MKCKNSVITQELLHIRAHICCGVGWRNLRRLQNAEPDLSAHPEDHDSDHDQGDDELGAEFVKSFNTTKPKNKDCLLYTSPSPRDA